MRRTKNLSVMVIVVTMLVTIFVPFLGNHTVNAAVGDIFTVAPFSYTVTGADTVSLTGNQSTGNITIPDTVSYNGVNYRVTTMAPGLFKSNTMLKSVVIGKNIESIPNEAFELCSALTSVTFASGSALRSVGQSAFKECSALTTCVLPNTVTYIGGYAFHGCTVLSNFRFPTGLQEFGTLPDGTAYTFTDCNGLTSLDMSALTHITVIPPCTFYQCYNVVNVSFPPNLETIGAQAFYRTGYKNRTVATWNIPASVSTIGNQGLTANCSNAKNLTIKFHSYTAPSVGTGLFDRYMYVQYPSNGQGYSSWNFTTAGFAAGDYSVPAASSPVYCHVICSGVLLNVNNPLGPAIVSTSSDAVTVFVPSPKLT